ncbi:MAG: PQQ-dependent sugar dehydrogenase [Ginsengibacter sp.]
MILILAITGIVTTESCKEKTAVAKFASAETPVGTPSSTDLFKKYELNKITLPEGFSISVYAEIENARSMCLSPSGTLFVGNRDKDNVYAIVDNNKDGVADKIYKVASGLNTPNGVAFKDGTLYIAAISTIYRLENIEANLAKPPKPVVVYDKYPKDTHHGWKFIAFGPDGKLYIPVGAPCNICEKENPVYASITSINADGTNMQVYASGVRNSVGFTWHPITKQLYFTDNGRDMLGDNKPEDELNTAPEKGMHFGYPYCHQGTILDPEFGNGKNCSDYTAPIQTLGPHTASLGLRFYTGSKFPAKYKNALFIAQHGSWNRSTPLGYRVMVSTMDAYGKLAKAVPFAEGWLQSDGTVNGRPVDMQLMPDGSMLVSDDYKGVIYRISYKG